MNRMMYYILPLLILLLPLQTWIELFPSESRVGISPPVLPQAFAVDSEGMLQGMLAHNLWNKERGELTLDEGSQARSGEKAGVVCRLKGIMYAQLQEPQAMFSCGANKMSLLKEDEELSDGGMLREIHSDYVVVERAGDARREYLFGKKWKQR